MNISIGNTLGDAESESSIRFACILFHGKRFSKKDYINRRPEKTRLFHSCAGESRVLLGKAKDCRIEWVDEKIKSDLWA